VADSGAACDQREPFVHARRDDYRVHRKPTKVFTKEFWRSVTDGERAGK